MTKSLEDYLEAIHRLIEKTGGARVVDIAKDLDVKMPSVNNAVKELAKQDLAVYEKYQLIQLTEAGKKLASAILARHMLLKNVLLRLGVSEETAEHDACAMEHILSAETLNKFKVLMDHLPKKEPAGKKTACLRKNDKDLQKT